MTFVCLQYCTENDWETFYAMARANAQRLSKLIAEAADEVMPEPSLTANLNRDVFDVLLHNVRFHSCLDVSLSACQDVRPRTLHLFFGMRPTYHLFKTGCVPVVALSFLYHHKMLP